MKPPIKGMKTKPIGHEMMTGAWLGLVAFALSNENHRTIFKKETGIDISGVINSKGINRMIDHATGYEGDAVAKWCDWVTVNLWGIKER